MDCKNITKSLGLILLAATINGCVVTPKKVAGYDSKCMVSTQKVELTVEQMEVFKGINCLDGCRSQLAAALMTSAVVTTTSAIVSGSIAVVGNTVYWLESQGKCPNQPHIKKQAPQKPVEDTDEQYLITEEIITAKS